MSSAGVHLKNVVERDSPAMCDASASSSPPPRKRRRVMRNQCVGGDSPVGSLAERRIHRSSLMASTLDREEMTRSIHADLLRIQRRSPRRRPRPRPLM
jgi:hypothetical protein